MKLFQLAFILGSVGLLSGCGPLAPLSKLNLWQTVTNGRDGWQHPEAVVAALGIESGDSVAEIGAGKGYWLPWLSQAVGPDGRVFAVEVEAELVEALRERIVKQQLANVEVVLGEYADPKLPDGEIDLAITSLTYHHIDARVDYFANLRRDLSPSGRVAHLDDRDDLPRPVRWLPTKGHWSNVTEMTDEMDRAGYARVASFDFLPVQSFQIFEPRTAIPNDAAVSEAAGL